MSQRIADPAGIEAQKAAGAGDHGLRIGTAREVVSEEGQFKPALPLNGAVGRLVIIVAPRLLPQAGAGFVLRQGRGGRAEMTGKGGEIVRKTLIIEHHVQAVARTDAELAHVLTGVRRRQPPAKGALNVAERRRRKRPPRVLIKAPPEHRHHAVIRISDHGDLCVTPPDPKPQFPPDAARAHMRDPFPVAIGPAAGADNARF